MYLRCGYYDILNMEILFDFGDYILVLIKHNFEISNEQRMNERHESQEKIYLWIQDYTHKNK